MEIGGAGCRPGLGPGLGYGSRWGLGPGLLVLVLLLGGCGGGAGVRTGSPDSVEAGDIPDAVPRVEPRSKYGNPESYVVRGKRFHTKSDSAGHVERGLASWYGKQFHGRKTSSGEPYNMYAMTAAHRTLPLPTYVRVTNLDNGKTAVVRVNDRGPFHGPRVIDLSYAAAKKLGVVKGGTAEVEVRAIDPNRGDSHPGPFFANKVRKPRNGESARTQAAPRIPAVDPEVPGTREPAVQVAAAASGAKELVPAAAKAAPALPRPGGVYLQVGAFGNAGNAERLRQRLQAQMTQAVCIQAPPDRGPRLYKVRVGPLGSEGQVKQVAAQLDTLGVPEPRRVWN